MIVSISAPAAVDRPRRPRVLTPAVTAQLEAACAFATTPSRRGRLEVVLRRRAMVILGPDADPWLVARPSVLAQLGRIDDPDALRAAAAWAVAERRSARATAVELRRRRVGAAPPATVQGVSAALRASFNEYRASHPTLTWEVALEAAEGLTAAIKKAMGG